MKEIRYSAAPEFADRGAFLRRARTELRASLFVAWQLFRADLRARHRRALLGYIWLLLPAAVATGICLYLQSRRIIAVAPTELPYPLYVLTGVLLWQVFVDALNAPLRQLASHRQLVARSHVPHEAIILAGALDLALTGLLRLAVIVAAVFAFGTAPAPSLALVPFGMAALALLGFAFGMAAAPIGMLYDDVRHGLMLAAGFWFFLTPVIYPAPATGLIRFNPVTPLLDTTRAWILAPQAPSGFFLITLAAALMLIVAWLFYRLARPHVVARLG